MTAQLLFYESAVPLSKERHRDWSVRTGGDFHFARTANAVPLAAAEFAAAAGEYVIVFTGSGDTLLPAAILGLRDGENLFVSAGGQWNAKYVPAFVRRYPFVFSSNNDGAMLTLCIDENFAGCNQDGRGERLFNSEGGATPFLEQTLAFITDYQGQLQQTAEFCKTLRALDLLKPMKVDIKRESGQQVSLRGFLAVDRDQLRALPAEKLAELVRSNELELVYQHLSSMRNFSGLAERSAATAKAVAETVGQARH
jgi:hypothetical protein